MRLTILAIIASLALTSDSSTLEPGRYTGTLTIRGNRQFEGPLVPSRHLAGRVFYHWCEDFLGISFKDTVAPELSMDFMTRVLPLRLGAYRTRPKAIFGETSVFPAAGDTTLSGFFQLLTPDWGFFPDSGSLWLSRMVGPELEGRFSYSSPGVTLMGTFRALKRSCSGS